MSEIASSMNLHNPQFVVHNQRMAPQLTEEQIAKRRARALRWYHANKEERRQKRKDWQHANPEKTLAATKKWQAANPEKVRAGRRAWRAANKDKAKAARRRHTLSIYGLTVAEFEALFAAQGGVCAICNSPPSAHHRLAVDHCHTRGGLRGLLCASCNNGLGRFKDDPEILRAAAAYIEAHR